MINQVWPWIPTDAWTFPIFYLLPWWHDNAIVQTIRLFTLQGFHILLLISSNLFGFLRRSKYFAEKCLIWHYFPWWFIILCRQETILITLWYPKAAIHLCSLQKPHKFSSSAHPYLFISVKHSSPFSNVNSFIFRMEFMTSCNDSLSSLGRKMRKDFHCQILWKLFERC